MSYSLTVIMGHPVLVYELVQTESRNFTITYQFNVGKYFFFLMLFLDSKAMDEITDPNIDLPNNFQGSSPVPDQVSCGKYQLQLQQLALLNNSSFDKLTILLINQTIDVFYFICSFNIYSVDVTFDKFTKFFLIG